MDHILEVSCCSSVAYERRRPLGALLQLEQQGPNSQSCRSVAVNSTSSTTILKRQTSSSKSSTDGRRVTWYDEREEVLVICNSKAQTVNADKENEDRKENSSGNAAEKGKKMRLTMSCREEKECNDLDIDGHGEIVEMEQDGGDAGVQEGGSNSNWWWDTAWNELTTVTPVSTGVSWRSTVGGNGKDNWLAAETEEMEYSGTPVNSSGNSTPKAWQHCRTGTNKFFLRNFSYTNAQYAITSSRQACSVPMLKNVYMYSALHSVLRKCLTNIMRFFYFCSQQLLIQNTARGSITIRIKHLTAVKEVLRHVMLQR